MGLLMQPRRAAATGNLGFWQRYGRLGPVAAGLRACWPHGPWGCSCSHGGLPPRGILVSGRGTVDSARSESEDRSMNVIRDADADLGPLQGRTVAIIGYGNQGRAQAP